MAFLDFARLGRLDFQAPDFTQFPCLRLAFAALAVGGTAPTILNAANEVAVQAFLEGKLRFTEIAVAVEQVLARVTGHAADTLQQILADDALARSVACEWIAARAGGA